MSTSTTPKTDGARAPDVYAGIVTRATAYVLDLTMIFLSYVFGLAVAAFVIFLLSTQGFELSWEVQIGAAIGYLFYALIYFWYSLATFGKTIGMAMLGLRVTMGNSAKVGVIRSLVRVVALPVLMIFSLGLSVLGVVFGRRNRALHDVVAGTVVIYDSPERRAAALRVRRAGAEA